MKQDALRLRARKKCKHCGGAIAVRNPTGQCDHLCWPEFLTDEAKAANGIKPEAAS